MILLMGMGLLIGLIKVVVGVEIGGGEVGLGYLKKLRLWRFMVGGMVLKIWLVIGG
ncbi:hypothetical protein [Bacillus altitudinis]|uniref:hypothetical protein n=1 Tax=Bacillus altitudinis TaxID=293387 RepID=UPI001643ED47|nr:hypothetical protein [Bacillus altitudinis]